MENSPSIPDLLQQIKSKDEEISSISRKLREVENSLSAKETELKIEIDSLKQQNENKDELIKDYKTQLDNRKNQKTEVDKNQIETLENKIIDLENKLFQAEQNDQNSKRQITTLNQEVSSLKIELSKRPEVLPSTPLPKVSNDLLQRLPEGIDQDIKHQIEELVKENEDNVEFRENVANLLTEKEYSEARQSTLTAFYTPPVVISSIYKALEKMGLEKGNILEPSCRSW